MFKRRELARKAVRLLVKKIPKEKEIILKVDEFLGILSSAYRKDKIIRNFFLSPQIDRKEKIKVLDYLAKKRGAPKEVVEVLEYLVDINAMSLIPEIKRLYELELEKLMRMLKGELIIPRKLDKRTIEKIKKSINKFLNRDIEIEIKEDPSLIGGFIFKTQAYVLDTSIKTQLEKLARLGGV
ncbi:MAG TPA: F0F1 ATP synthase subunit delta [Aquifex aeolicus]|nr:F0F1 ATP synthase subunit delta [Aquifex aeolicus]